MDESEWVCERCGRQYDLEMGEGWVLLAAEAASPGDGRISSREPYEAVCYDCADVLHGLVEKCDRNCADCEVPRMWGLSIKNCLQFQMEFGLLELRVPMPRRKVSFMGCPCDAKMVLGEFKTYWRSLGVKWEE